MKPFSRPSQAPPGANRTDHEPELPNSFFLLIAVFWTAAMAAFSAWDAVQYYYSVRANAETAARHSYGKDLTYRLWNTGHGGVYVPVTPETQPNEHLAHLPERDIVTSSGRVLTLTNPAYMTRQVHAIADESFGTRGHITSLKPIRPENGPDDWERRALKDFEAGVEERVSLEIMGEETYLRLMRPLKVEEACLKCHAAQGYRIGDVRGGISVSIAWEPYRKTLFAVLPFRVLGYGGIWALGMAGVWFSRQRLFRDVARRKQAEEERSRLAEQLRHAQKMEAVGRLAGGVAHDFNNMLGIIIGSAELAKMSLSPSAPLLEDIEAIHRAGQRSADLVRQLLAFARKQTIAPKVLDLNETIGQMLKMLKRLIGEDIDLAWQPAEQVWPVNMDPAQIDQLLANLVVNARDAIAGHGQIVIGTENVKVDAEYCRDHLDALPGAYVVISVRDDGCGMGRETLERLFEPFFTTKPQGSGTGLGLATVHGIVTQNHGFVSVSSQPGKGTSFRIHLPRHAEDAAPEPLPASARRDLTGSETVLLVEDEEPLLAFGKRILQDLGYTVLTASLPSQAIRMADEYAGTIHLLVTDVVMPEMNGRDLETRLKVTRPGIRAVFISGYTADVIARRGVLDPGVHFLQKPFSREALGAKLREAISG